MCQMCEREVEFVENIVNDLTRDYGEDCKNEEHAKLTEAQQIMSLANVLNCDVREHYGVINGRIAATAIHRLVHGHRPIELTTQQASILCLQFNTAHEGPPLIISDMRAIVTIINQLTKQTT